MAHEAATPAGYLDRILSNIRLLKAIRGMSDTDIAERGQFTSRQLLNHRITGRTIPTTDDLARIAAALRVEPGILSSPNDVVLRWAQEHDDYTPPEMPPPMSNRDIRPLAAEAAAADTRNHVQAGAPAKTKKAATKKAAAPRRQTPASR